MTAQPWKRVKGWSNLKVQIAHRASEQYVHLWSGLGSFSNNPMGINWLGIVFGLGAIISMGYWTPDPLVVQRILAAKIFAARRWHPSSVPASKCSFRSS